MISWFALRSAASLKRYEQDFAAQEHFARALQVRSLSSESKGKQHATCTEQTTYDMSGRIQSFRCARTALHCTALYCTVLPLTSEPSIIGPPQARQDV